MQTGGVEGSTRWPYVPSWHLGHSAAIQHPERRDPGQRCVLAGWGHSLPVPWANGDGSSFRVSREVPAWEATLACAPGARKGVITSPVSSLARVGLC